MSAGDFETLARYQASYSETAIHPIRVQPETLAAVLDGEAEPDVLNEGATGAITNPISALISLSRRQRGLRARFITARWNGTPPEGYSPGTFNLVILRVDRFNAISIGDQITYLGSGATVQAKEPERVR